MSPIKKLININNKNTLNKAKHDKPGKDAKESVRESPTNINKSINKIFDKYIYIYIYIYLNGAKYFIENGHKIFHISATP